MRNKKIRDFTESVEQNKKKVRHFFLGCLWQGIYVPTTWKIDARDGKMVRQTFDSRGQTFDSEGESCFSERSEAKHSPEESKVCPRESKVPNHFSIPGKFNFSCSRIHFLAC